MSIFFFLNEFFLSFLFLVFLDLFFELKDANCLLHFVLWYQLWVNSSSREIIRLEAMC